MCVSVFFFNSFDVEMAKTSLDFIFTIGSRTETTSGGLQIKNIYIYKANLPSIFSSYFFFYAN